MLVIRARLDVRPDKRADFLDAITDVVYDSRRIDGVVSFDICESVTQPNVFLSVEVYESEGAWNQHRQSDIFTAALPVLESCLAKGLDGRVFEVSGTRPLEL